MKITNHFDLGFRETSNVSFLFTPPKGPTRRRFWLIILGGLIVLGILLLLCILTLQGTGPTDFPSIKAPGPMPVEYKSLPVLLALGALLFLGLCLGLLAFILHLLRRGANQLYWQLACWFLVSIGILLRPFVASGVNPLQTTIKGAIIAGVVALGVFPGLMRLLNRLKPEPGLLHVALPFALGFFLDVAQVVAKTYVPGLSWLR